MPNGKRPALRAASGNDHAERQREDRTNRGPERISTGGNSSFRPAIAVSAIDGRRFGEIVYKESTGHCDDTG